jgi:hypothetical protein
MHPQPTRLPGQQTPKRTKRQQPLHPTSELAGVCRGHAGWHHDSLGHRERQAIRKRVHVAHADRLRDERLE